jgi:hypothetical protein
MWRGAPARGAVVRNAGGSQIGFVGISKVKISTAPLQNTNGDED